MATSDRGFCFIRGGEDPPEIRRAAAFARAGAVSWNDRQTEFDSLWKIEHHANLFLFVQRRCGSRCRRTSFRRAVDSRRRDQSAGCRRRGRRKTKDGERFVVGVRFGGCNRPPAAGRRFRGEDGDCPLCRQAVDHSTGQVAQRARTRFRAGRRRSGEGRRVPGEGRFALRPVRSDRRHAERLRIAFPDAQAGLSEPAVREGRMADGSARDGVPAGSHRRTADRKQRRRRDLRRLLGKESL